MFTTLLTAAALLFATGVGTLMLALAAFRTVSRFRSELVRIRLSDGLDEVRVREVPTDRDGVSDLREAVSLLISAEGGFRSGLRRARWELVGLGNPELRLIELATASGELLQAQKAIRQARLKMPNVGIEAGQDVPVFHDPVRALAARGRWGTWAALSVLPRFVRGVYGYRRTRAQILELLEVTEALLEQVDAYRKTVEPAPVRISLRDRVALAA